MTDTKYKYDIFLSYSRSDVKSVEKVARYLSDAGLNVWFDEWSLVPGQQWKVSLKEAIESSFVIAVFVGPLSLSNLQRLEWEAVLNKQMKGEVNRVIPVLLPGSSIDFIPFSLCEICALDLRKGLRTSHEINELAHMITKNKNLTGGPGITAGNDVSISDGFRCKKSGYFTKPVKNITNRIFIRHKQVNNDTKSNSYSLKRQQNYFCNRTHEAGKTSGNRSFRSALQ